MGMQEDAGLTLITLASYQKEGDPREARGHYEFEGPELAELTGLAPFRLNDAVELLEQNGFVELQRFLGTAPFIFHSVHLTSRGRFQAEQMTEAGESAQEQAEGSSAESETSRSAPITTPPQPVGSPFGFTDQDWESVIEDRSAKDRLIVVLGHQWESEHFSSEELRKNIAELFTRLLASIRTNEDVSLDFKPLAAGYGSHLFNEIARDIISADIALFETSDLNPNVMIEMGVALTWGTRVLPIREKNTPEPPSDISGQTWAKYENNGLAWTDEDHEKKLLVMIRRALAKKGVTVLDG